MPGPRGPVHPNLPKEFITYHHVTVAVAKRVREEVRPAGPFLREAPEGPRDADHDHMLGEYFIMEFRRFNS